MSPVLYKWSCDEKRCACAGSEAPDWFCACSKVADKDDCPSCRAPMYSVERTRTNLDAQIEVLKLRLTKEGLS